MTTANELATKLKDSLSDDEKTLLSKLISDSEMLAKAADSDGDGKADSAGLKSLFLKNGEFSKTSAILVCAWVAGIVLWCAQSLFHGVQLPGIGSHSDLVANFVSGCYHRRIET